MIGAQTGTGKTLAYCLPLIHRLKMSELQSQKQLTEPNRPRALILVPNRELV
jgi:superfamily II DNA/RNA helicase